MSPPTAGCCLSAGEYHGNSRAGLPQRAVEEEEEEDEEGEEEEEDCACGTLGRLERFCHPKATNGEKKSVSR